MCVKNNFNKILLKKFHTKQKRIALNLRTLDFINLKKTDAILDSSCGQGELLEILFERGYSNLAGIDINADLISTCKKNLPKAVFLNSSLTKTPFKNNQFNTIFSYLTLHHILDISESIKEFERILKPSGHIYLLDFFTINKIHSYIVNSYGCPEDYYFNKFYSMSEFEQMLSKSNLKISNTFKIRRGILGDLFLLEICFKY